MNKKLIVLGIIAMLVTTAVWAAQPAEAARGGKKPTSSAVASGIVLNESSPRRGDAISFTITYPSMNEQARVRLLCYQAGELVYQYSQGSDGSLSWAPVFILGSALWNSGSASCAADLFYFTWSGTQQTGVVYLAHTDFQVSE